MLKPVEGQTLETGVKGALFNGGLNLSGAIYQIDIKKITRKLTLHTQQGALITISLVVVKFVAKVLNSKVLVI